MRAIIPGITRLLQHLTEIKQNPESYRPSNCMGCGCCGLWRHGSYERKSDRESKNSPTLNPIPIPRFYCPHCRHTCSVLPECIPPRRWYLWEVQQTVLLLLFSGLSATAISQSHAPGRRTIRRWLRSLRERFIEFSACLKSKYSALGYQSDFTPFWQDCFERLGLAKAMLFLNHQGIMIP